MSIQVRDFKYIPGENDTEYIKLLKQHIERQDAIIRSAIKKLKADPKTGEWIGEGDGYSDGEIVYDTWYCSECDWCIEEDDQDSLPNYCPQCGAYMKGEKE